MTSSARWPAALLAVTASLSAPRAADAGGFQIEAHDAGGTGRAFAEAAGVDDASAAFYNPAAIARLKASGVRFGFQLVTSRIDYDPDPGFGRDEETDRGNHVVPHLFAAFDLSEHVDAGLAVFVPFGLASDWPKDPDWAGRYLALDNTVTFVFIEPIVSIAIPFVEGLSIGGGPQVVLALEELGPVRLNNAVDLRAAGAPDGEFVFEGHTRRLNVGYNLALHYAPPLLDGRLKLGVNWRSTPDGHELEGKALFRGVPAAVGLPERGDGRTKLRLPSWLQVGVEIELIPDLLRLEVDYKWTDWRSLDSVRLEVEGIPDSVIEFQWDDTHMIMLGVEAQPLPELTVRAGYYYDPSPIPRKTLSPLLPGEDRHGLTLGVGLKLGAFRLDVSYVHVFVKSATKRNLVGAFSPGGDATASGKYDNRIDLVGLTLGFAF